jgi:uncharacterized damage-inducible protein DinB
MSMDEKSLLLGQLELTRQMTVSLLETIEKSGADVHDALAWQPGAGRAHIGWQLMHIAATDDRYLNFRLLGKPMDQVDDKALVDSFGGGSRPGAANVPVPEQIRATLARTRAKMVAHIQSLEPSLLDVKPFPDALRTNRAAFQFLAWHEAHHQGQAHLTWNLYKATHGIK